MARGYTVTAKVIPQRALARLKKFEKAVEKAGHATVKDLINIGKAKAQQLVPKGSTGWLYSQISGRQLSGPNPVGMIYLKRQILPNDGIHRRVPPKNATWRYLNNFNLARWMHTSPRAVAHIKHGDPHFMYTTKAYLEGRKKTVAAGNYNRIITNTR
jgi:hypothetical protein